jgi:hypothetical protein
MASVTAIRDAIAAQLSLITTLNVYSAVSDSVMVPAAIVGIPQSIEYDYTFRSANFKMMIPIRVLAARIQEDYAQELLDAYISYEGASSIPLSLGLDTQLSATVQTSRVTEARNYGVYEVEGISYLGVEFMLEVIA